MNDPPGKMQPLPYLTVRIWILVPSPGFATLSEVSEKSHSQEVHISGTTRGAGRPSTRHPHHRSASCAPRELVTRCAETLALRKPAAQSTDLPSTWRSPQERCAGLEPTTPQGAAQHGVLPYSLARLRFGLQNAADLYVGLRIRASPCLPRKPLPAKCARRHSRCKAAVSASPSPPAELFGISREP